MFHGEHCVTKKGFQASLRVIMPVGFSDCQTSRYDFMEAGRELDQLIATKVMKHTVFSISPIVLIGLQEANENGATRDLAHYSTDISAAWEVVEKFQKEAWKVTVSNLGDRSKFENDDYIFDRWICRVGTNRAKADTAPLAICLAALKAVGER
jgi:hypothetical protein